MIYGLDQCDTNLLPPSRLPKGGEEGRDSEGTKEGRGVMGEGKRKIEEKMTTMVAVEGRRERRRAVGEGMWKRGRWKGAKRVVGKRSKIKGKGRGKK